MSKAILSEGTILQRADDGSPTQFTTISEVVSIQGLGGGSATVIDVTHLQSEAKEKRIGLPDNGQVTLELNYIPQDSTQKGLLQDRKNRTERQFQLVATDSPSTELRFNAYVLSAGRSWGVDEKVAFSVTLEVTGAITGDT